MSDYLTVEQIRAAVELLKESCVMPKRGQNFTMIVHPYKAPWVLRRSGQHRQAIWQWLKLLQLHCSEWRWFFRAFPYRKYPF